MYPIKIDLWSLHVDPKQVIGHNYRLHVVSKFAFEQLRSRKLNNNDTKIAEKTISNDSWYSYYYAKKTLKERFLGGERAIKKSEFKFDYLNFIKSL